MKSPTTTIALTLALSLSTTCLPHHSFLAGRRIEFHSASKRSPSLANIQPGHTNGMAANLERRAPSIADNLAEFQGYPDLSKRDTPNPIGKHKPPKQEGDDCSEELEEDIPGHHDKKPHDPTKKKLKHPVVLPGGEFPFSRKHKHHGTDSGPGKVQPAPEESAAVSAPLPAYTTQSATAQAKPEVPQQFGDKKQSQPAHPKPEVPLDLVDKKQWQPTHPKPETFPLVGLSKSSEVAKPKLVMPTDTGPFAKFSSTGEFPGATHSPSSKTGHGGPSGFSWSSETFSSSSTSSSSGASTSSSFSSSSSGGGGGLAGEIFAGKATFFTQDNNAGACGVRHSDHDFIVAIQNKMYKHGELCGKTIAVTRHSTGRTIHCIAADECPGCPTAASLDLSVGAFDALGRPEEGVFDISWKIVS